MESSSATTCGLGASRDGRRSAPQDRRSASVGPSGAHSRAGARLRHRRSIGRRARGTGPQARPASRPRGARRRVALGVSSPGCSARGARGQTRARRALDLTARSERASRGARCPALAAAALDAAPSDSARRDGARSPEDDHAEEDQPHDSIEGTDVPCLGGVDASERTSIGCDPISPAARVRSDHRPFSASSPNGRAREGRRAAPCSAASRGARRARRARRGRGARRSPPRPPPSRRPSAGACAQSGGAREVGDRPTSRSSAMRTRPCASSASPSSSALQRPGTRTSRGRP